MYVLAAPAPRPDAVLEPSQGCVHGLTSGKEAAEAVQDGKVVVAGLGADGGAAVGLDEVDRLGVAVVLEVEQDVRHRRRIYRQAVEDQAQASNRLLFHSYGGSP